MTAIISSVIRSGGRREPGRFGTVTRRELSGGRRKKSAEMIPVPAEAGRNIKTAAAGKVEKGALLETISGDDIHRRITKNEI